jgi:hypothetical protein
VALLAATFMAAGALACAGYLAFPRVMNGLGITRNDASTAGSAVTQMNASYGALTSKLNVWQHATSACQGNLSCVTKQDAKAARFFAAFTSQLTATTVPGSAMPAQERLRADAGAASYGFIRLSGSTSVADYQNTFASTRLQHTLANFDRDYAVFVQALLDF